MKKTLVNLTYSIQIKLKDFYVILGKDTNEDEPLYSLLYRIDGVLNVDYNGHFGNYIYLTTDNDYNTPATWEKIYKTIDNYIEGE